MEEKDTPCNKNATNNCRRNNGIRNVPLGNNNNSFN